MHIRCPHCQHAVEVVGTEEFASVTCPSCGSSFDLLPETTSFWLSKRTIGHFELLDQLGTGGFGAVWKARDTKLDRLVAIKVPRVDHSDPEHAELFLREARAAAQLRHPQIVAVHEVGRDDGTLYIVSDFVEGVTLADRLTVGPFTPREAAELLAQVAEALHHAHEAGVIHRDLKPSNIMLDGSGRPLLMDFGLAKRDAGEITMTIDGKVLGTPAYMSPEQARGEGHRVDRRTDVYSLGVILFELLTGERPFRGNRAMLLNQVLHDEPPSPRKLNSRVPRDLETICLKCLEKLPESRYATAEALVADCRRLLNGDSIIARPSSMPQRFWKWYRQRINTIAGAIAIFSCGLAGANGLVWSTIVIYTAAIKPWTSGLVMLPVSLLPAVLGVGSGIFTLRGKRLGLWGSFLIMGMYAVGGISSCMTWIQITLRTGALDVKDLNNVSILSSQTAWFLVGSLVQLHALVCDGKEPRDL